ncbi:hypothetical protein BRADI_4g45090v3 [Brachypodium distachyon]|uniref:At1g61320/AtMIF1 LRR domain-containing protein n=1 Tax=Brachypodium distachyon TaxID=15368 RepID=A0A2K2CUA9_BRADI|nr:hypothetical protein BRADI_4g45090v3 [Brachypodium distachyon]
MGQLHVLAFQDLQHFLSKCPVLEWLSIRSCSQKCNLHASEPLCRLKYLCVQDSAVNKIDLVAPNLNTFEYKGSQILINFHECLKLKKASFELNVQQTLDYVFTGIPNVLPHVEALRVEAYVVFEMPGFKHAPLVFSSHLRHLALKIQMKGKTSVLQLGCLLEAAPLLEDLCLDMNCTISYLFPIDGDLIAGCRHYNLKTASVSGFCGDGGQVELVKYIMRNATQLKRMTIETRNRVVKWPHFMEEYEGRTSAMENLVPLEKAGVLRVL